MKNIWGRKFTVISFFIIVLTGIALYMFDENPFRRVDRDQIHQDSVQVETVKDTLVDFK